MVSLFILTSCLLAQTGTDITFCGGAPVCAGENELVADIRVLQQSGARPRFSPDGLRGNKMTQQVVHIASVLARR